jgi:hypothetical protein
VKSIKVIILALLLCSLLMIRCTSIPIRLASSNQQIEDSEVDFSKGRHLSSSASGYQILLFIPISINDRQERAYKMLRGQANEDYLSNIRIKESWTYIYIGTIYTTTLEATAYPYK